MDLTKSIEPRSDQLNADDLIAGPMTVTITEVKAGNAEQPVDVHLVEFPGRPFKPSKTVRRIMVAAWGADSSTYPGQRMTLYRDPAVKFGGQDVGGIRVSSMSGLSKRLVIALTVTRGKRAPYVVEPLADAPAAPSPMQQLADAFTAAGITDKNERLDYCIGVIGRVITSAANLSPAEIGQVCDALNA